MNLLSKRPRELLFGKTFRLGILTFKPALSRIIVLLAVQLLVSSGAMGQDFKIVFWNLENYFDTRDDVATADDEFTPMGERYWSRKKFNEKRNGIAKTLLLLSGGELPTLIGLAEAENRYVLRQLTEATALSLAGYGIIHRDSPDARGIDVGLLYRKERYTPITSDFIYVRLPDTTAKTRLILYSKGVLDKLDTIHVFVNHWPSKYGSGTLSDSRRETAAGALKIYCDSLLYRNSRANILIMGDFNETPDKSAASALAGFTNLAGNLMNRIEGKKRGRNTEEKYTEKLLGNKGKKQFGSNKEEKLLSSEDGKLSNGSKGKKALSNDKNFSDYSMVKGSIKFMGVWELIDHFLVSSNLLDTLEPIYCHPGSMEIFSHPALLEKDKGYLGVMPKRTYKGPRYNGGYSDHLPVVMTIKKVW